MATNSDLGDFRNFSSFLISSVLPTMLLYTITTGFDGAKVQFYIQMAKQKSAIFEFFFKNG
jgi:hypothetical protein